MQQWMEWSIGAEGFDPLAAGNLTCGLVVGALRGVDPELRTLIGWTGPGTRWPR
ncbi:hypothetical protein [Actinoallomurus sp. NPDC050550]|uniref:hypothetical protein n=1 Tax=Actinoallomurus sp. NPDC050550 TaxID=3154937 RepID=UPI0033E4FA3C